ncbi:MULTISPECIES: response regulator [unclassified Bosea (in: a-proteobacteria)]|jgi:two-component system KDP operon response regulator KdpE|uniref:response regulator n=1 Tax=unclassified Bosea (in: a-proteobacteria) TaxID=2653178 RepID=UPI000F75654F|nr:MULTISPECIES: response regulator [unclassified Bosea (in: a-proteobacteria)]AZO77257.1 DNA-binding response regulator [Bosea sp. Tri-49]RXT22110.1 DNA-binding response regulator [Bosea sp. Tri-39]RXT32452.1 DNA-binding response regulator [Bosea sp. Tri-54]
MTAFRPRILVIDDEPQIHRFLGPALDAAGYEPIRADDATTGLREIARKPPDAVVLDLGLPDMDGKEALAKARAFYDGPVIILSARDRETEKIDALDAGADDYVEKPFGVGELLARLRVALRHRLERQGSEPALQVGDVEIDLVNRRISKAGVPVKLSPKEYDLLASLAGGNGRVLTHKQILTAVWGPAHEHDVQYLRVFVGQLRQKLEDDPAEPKLIETEPGVGYRLGGLV